MRASASQRPPARTRARPRRAPRGPRGERRGAACLGQLEAGRERLAGIGTVAGPPQGGAEGDQGVARSSAAGRPGEDRGGLPQQPEPLLAAGDQLPRRAGRPRAASRRRSHAPARPPSARAPRPRSPSPSSRSAKAAAERQGRAGLRIPSASLRSPQARSSGSASAGRRRANCARPRAKSASRDQVCGESAGRRRRGRAAQSLPRAPRSIGASARWTVAKPRAPPAPATRRRSAARRGRAARPVQVAAQERGPAADRRRRRVGQRRTAPARRSSASSKPASASSSSSQIASMLSGIR